MNFFKSLIYSPPKLWRVVKTILGIIFRHPIPGTSIIATLSDGRIVLIRRSDDGCWALPGGMVDWGEDIPSVVRRELREET
ncbi:NUDIX hydrolase, partial [Cylindrospermopsis raciborskii]